MNKTLKEATTEEVKDAYINKAPLMIWTKRQESVITDIQRLYSTGEIEYKRICTFRLKQALQCNLGFEFRLWRANKNRKERIKKRIFSLIETQNAYFLTLTFSPAFLERETSEETRRRYIRRFLKEQCIGYVANVDYGKTNDREHYHAVVVPRGSLVDFKPYCDFFDKSRIDAEKISLVNTEKSRDCLARYINKLTNHALKDSGHSQRLIYSRGC